MSITIFQNNIESQSREKKIRGEDLLKVALEREHPADIILLSEFGYDKHREDILKPLASRGYNIIYPLGFDMNDLFNPIFTAGCVIALREGLDFEYYPSISGFKPYRYIAGKALSDSFTLSILLAYIPNTLTTALSTKAAALKAVRVFWDHHKTRNVFIGGDFNTDPDTDTTCNELFEPILNEAIETNNHLPTWKNKCFDYALVSESLKGSVTMPVRTESDHMALITELKI